MPKTADSPSEVWVDVIRTIAIFAVVLVHVTAPITLEFGNVAAWNWHVGNALDSLARPCVPLFFMISGYLLLGRDEPAAIFFRKRLTRIAAPMIFWSLFYLIFTNRNAFSALQWTDLTDLLTSPAEYHLWFLYALIAVYLLVPLLRLLVLKTNANALQFITLIWLTLASIGPTLEWWGIEKDFGSVALLLGYTGYALAGYALGTLKLTRTYIATAAVVAVISYITITWGTWSASVRSSAFAPDIYNYVGPIVIVYSCALFVLLRGVCQKFLATPPPSLNRAIQWASGLSFGVYLIHAAVLELLFKSGLSLFNIFGPSPLLASLSTTITTLAISTVLIALTRRIPVLGRFIG